MINHKASTLWEGWEVGSGTYGGGSYNHGWSGGPLTLMQEYLAGITPGKPGYQSIHIFPQPSGIKHFKATAPLPGGRVAVTWSQQQQKMQLKVSEANRPILVGIPIPSSIKMFKQVRVNNKIVKPSDLRRVTWYHNITFIIFNWHGRQPLVIEGFY